LKTTLASIASSSNLISSLHITQAFKLFLEGKKPIEVAINLNLGADEVDRLYQQFWRLERLHQLTLVYQETRRYLPSFLKLFKIMKEQKMMSEQDIINALKHAKELQSFETRVQELIVKIQTLENKKKESTEYLSALLNQIYHANSRTRYLFLVYTILLKLHEL
jgi:hypothetical protein